MVIFGISFTIGKNDKVAPTLNITLANHKSAKAPEKADFLAQNNQEASGTEAEVKELSTTEIAKVSDTTINQVNPVPDQLARNVVDEKKREALATTSRAQRQLPQNKPQQEDVKPVEGEDLDTNAQARNQKLASLQAKLDQQRQALAREPRITRHTSVSAKSSDEAAYYNYWSNKIIRVGNSNFPEEALKKEIFGSLRMEVGIRADGSVASIEVTNSSGHRLLDDAARRIVKLAEPYNPLPPEIKKNTDIFVIYRTWNFEITGLSTSD